MFRFPRTLLVLVLNGEVLPGLSGRIRTSTFDGRNWLVPNVPMLR